MQNYGDAGLQLRAAVLPSVPEKAQISMQLALPGDGAYSKISAHIASVFREHYDAEITVQYPLLMGLVDAQQQPLAALGVRTAIDESPLFLERYLDVPAEQAVQAIMQENVDRRGIAEAGNLASKGKSDIFLLLCGLAFHLQQEGMTHILFTGTALLQRYLQGLGLRPYLLAAADPVRLGAEAFRWGTYYETRPKVMVGRVEDFCTGLARYRHRLQGK